MNPYLTKLAEFKEDLAKCDADSISDKYLFTSGSVVLGTSREIGLCEAIAQRFLIQPSDVHVVGSAKLGFTIKPGDRYRPFGDQSDVDVVIISESLFQAVWIEAFHFWNCGAFWSRRDDFQHYLFRGWIRPDKLPPGDSFRFTKEWNGYFRDLTSSGQFGVYPIKAGLYSRLAFAKGYHRRCIEACREGIL